MAVSYLQLFASLQQTFLDVAHHVARQIKHFQICQHVELGR